MAQNDNNKEANALSDDFLGQVSGGRAISDAAAQKEFLDAINRDPNRGLNYWDAHGIPDPHKHPIQQNEIKF